MTTKIIIIIILTVMQAVQGLEDRLATENEKNKVLFQVHSMKEYLSNSIMCSETVDKLTTVYKNYQCSICTGC